MVGVVDRSSHNKNEGGFFSFLWGIFVFLVGIYRWLGGNVFYCVETWCPFWLIISEVWFFLPGIILRKRAWKSVLLFPRSSLNLGPSLTSQRYMHFPLLHTKPFLFPLGMDCVLTLRCGSPDLLVSFCGVDISFSIYSCSLRGLK